MKLLFIDNGQKLYDVFGPYLEDFSIYVAIGGVAFILSKIQKHDIAVLILDEDIDSVALEILVELLQNEVVIIMITSMKDITSFTNPGFNRVVRRPEPGELVELIKSFEKVSA